MPPLPDALIRPTMPPEPVEQDGPAAGPEAIEPAEGQGRGAVEPRATAQRAKRRRADAPAEKPSKRGLHLTDAVWERLQLEALNRKTSVSAVAEDLLAKNLPRLWIGGRKDA